MFSPSLDLSCSQVEWDTDPGTREVQWIKTYADTGPNEIQSITTTADDVDEVQKVTITADEVQEIQVSFLLFPFTLKQGSKGIVPAEL